MDVFNVNHNNFNGFQFDGTMNIIKENLSIKDQQQFDSFDADNKSIDILNKKCNCTAYVADYIVKVGKYFEIIPKDLGDKIFNLGN